MPIVLAGQKKTDEDEERLLVAAGVAAGVAAAVADSFLHAREIRDELQLSISCQTIWCRLKKAGLHNCVVEQKPRLSERQRRQRLEFAQALEQCTVHDCSQIIFTDGSTFCTRWDHQRRIWRPLNCGYG